MRRSRFAELGDVLAALEHPSRELVGSAPGAAVDLRARRSEPAERIPARLEIAGPKRSVASVRAGVDVRGDGSVHAYRERVCRQVIEPRRGESASTRLAPLPDPSRALPHRTSVWPCRRSQPACSR